MFFFVLYAYVLCVAYVLEYCIFSRLSIIRKRQQQVVCVCSECGVLSLRFFVHGVDRRGSAKHGDSSILQNARFGFSDCLEKQIIVVYVYILGQGGETTNAAERNCGVVGVVDGVDVIGTWRTFTHVVICLFFFIFYIFHIRFEGFG